jgi:hypothetical protein
MKQADVRQAPQMLTPEAFLRMTKAKSVQVGSQAINEGGTNTFRLPQAGLGSMLWVTINGTITVTGTLTGGTFKSFLSGGGGPAPFSILKKVSFGSNNSFSMINLSGWNLYRWIRERTGIDIMNTGASTPFSANNCAFLGIDEATAIVNGATPSAQTYTVNMCFPIPIAYNMAADTGLLLLQSNGTFFDLNLNFGTITQATSTSFSNDLVSSVTSSAGVSIAQSLTVKVELDWFEYVPGVESLMSQFLSVNDQQQSLVLGENVIVPPVNDLYTMFLIEVINNGAPVAVANLSNIYLRHSGNQYDYLSYYASNLLKNYYIHAGLPPIDGNINLDFGVRRGWLERRDNLDAIDNLNITDLNIGFTNAAAVTGQNGVNTIMESLRYIQQRG